MTDQNLIKDRVHQYYWDNDLNCATTTIRILAEKFSMRIENQVYDAALGMHGAAYFGAQCGLVEGGLMFIGMYGRLKNVPDNEIEIYCNKFAAGFEERFGSLLCRELRPEGFHPNNPPHLCENLTNLVLQFDIQYLNDCFKSQMT